MRAVHHFPFYLFLRDVTDSSLIRLHLRIFTSVPLPFASAWPRLQRTPDREGRAKGREAGKAEGRWNCWSRETPVPQMSAGRVRGPKWREEKGRRRAKSKSFKYVLLWRIIVIVLKLLRQVLVSVCHPPEVPVPLRPPRMTADFLFNITNH